LFPAGLTIRAAEPEDSAAIGRVHVDAWRSAYAGLIPDEVLVGMSQRNQAVQWARILARPRPRDAVFVGVDESDGLVGFGNCGPVRSQGTPGEGEVYTLYVDPDHQGAGIGSALLKVLLETLADAGMPSAIVWVLTLNPSRYFYEAMGGQRFAERDERLWGTILRETGYVWTQIELPWR